MTLNTWHSYLQYMSTLSTWWWWILRGHIGLTKTAGHLKEVCHDAGQLLPLVLTMSRQHIEVKKWHLIIGKDDDHQIHSGFINAIWSFKWQEVEKRWWRGLETQHKTGISDQTGRAPHIAKKKKKKNLLQYDHAATSSSTCLSQKVLGCMTRKKKLFSKKQSQHVNATE